jgi:hypothetical protein
VKEGLMDALGWIGVGVVALVLIALIVIYNRLVHFAIEPRPHGHRSMCS